MKVLLDIEDEKASSLLEVLNGLPYVTTEEVDEKLQLIAEIKDAVEELNLVKSGEKEARSARELFDEL